MNHNIQTLLELQVIDKRRLALRSAREASMRRVHDAEQALSAAQAAAATAQADVDRLGALTRQYISDVERCERTVTELRAKQPDAKTNKEYMDLINGIEAAKLEKIKRESSLKDLANRVKDMESHVAALNGKVEVAKAAHEALASEATTNLQPSPEELELQRQYDELKAKADPAFVEHYERLVKAHHKSPLLRVNPTTRATPFGSLLSQNVIEQLHAGKLVVDRGSNGILYLG